MTLLAPTAGSIGDDVNVISSSQGALHGEVQTNFGPQPGNYQLGLASLLDLVAYPLIVPGVQAGTVNRLLLGEHRLYFLEKQKPLSNCR